MAFAEHADPWPCGLLTLDDAGDISAANYWFEDRLGHPVESLIGRHVSILLLPVGRIYLETHFFPLLRLQHFCQEIALDLRARDGGRLPCLLTARLTAATERDPPRIHIAVMEARERRRYEQELLSTKRTLEARNLEIDHANAQLAARNTALDRLASEMDVARAAAEAANASKSSFLAHMSHEIRTPLNGVLGMIDLLGETPLDERQRGMLGIVRESGWSLLALLNDILDVARLEAGRMQLALAPFDLAALTQRLVALHQANAQAKGLDFAAVCSPGGPLLRLGDETRVMQILQNLIGNAIKFTERGSVRLEVNAEGQDGVILCVRDTGIGMSDDQCARIFEPFEQAEAGTARRFGGSGLGMSIAHRLVAMMDGAIRVESALGEGTMIEVHIALPLVRDTPDTVLSQGSGEVDTTTDAPQYPGRHALVADDNEVNRLILSAMLAKSQIETTFASNGAEALALWRETPFDLIFLDISMPVMDGMEALAIMRHEAAQQRASCPRVVASTANVMAEQCLAYREAGFAGVLAKPFHRENLYAVLGEALR